MDKRRLRLSKDLKTIVPNVYFQPPESKALNYPCIIYDLSKIDTKHADNIPYLNAKLYTLTLICDDPDNDYVDQIMSRPYTSFSRHYETNNQHHYVFERYN